MSGDFEFRSNIVMCKSEPPTFIALLHWVGGMRFEAHNTVENCRNWIRIQMDEIARDFEVIE